MKSEKINDDYYVYLTEGDCKFLTEPASKFLPFRYNHLEEKVRGAEEKLQLLCTNDSNLIFDNEKAHDQIYFDRDKEIIIVRVYTPHILSLLNGEKYVMTRYNGKDKLWIFQEN